MITWLIDDYFIGSGLLDWLMITWLIDKYLIDNYLIDWLELD